jgi:hypothetical protein
MVGGESMADTSLLHDDERDTIHERPLLVRSLIVQSDAALKLLVLSSLGVTVEVMLQVSRCVGRQAIGFTGILH